MNNLWQSKEVDKPFLEILIELLKVETNSSHLSINAEKLKSVIGNDDNLNSAIVFSKVKSFNDTLGVNGNVIYDEIEKYTDPYFVHTKIIELLKLYDSNFNCEHMRTCPKQSAHFQIFYWYFILSINNHSPKKIISIFKLMIEKLESMATKDTVLNTFQFSNN